MKKNQWGRLILLVILSLLDNNNIKAQTIPDNTLGQENSIVNQLNETLQNIEGGAIRGNNLFHSFSDFNISEGNAIHFVNPSGIVNILTRITGKNSSQILGELGVLGSANLFFINPNGIFFGPNAQLNINGSFIASTASSILLSDGSEFSATNPQIPPLLTISVPVGLQFNGLPQSIVSQAILTIAPHQTIALVGGEILIQGSEIVSESGRISLGAVQENSIVNLATDNLGWRLDYSQIQNGGDINISEASFLDVTGDTGGNIEIYGKNINIIEQSYLDSYTSSFGNGSDISIFALESVTVEDSGISTGIFSQNEDQADKAGDVNITANRLNVNRSQIGSLTEGTELGGDLNLQVGESINLNGFIEDDDGIAPGGLFSQSCSPESCADGDAGNILIKTKELILQNGSVIDTATFGQGKSGNIDIQASQLIRLEGSDILTGIFAQTGQDALAMGDAGNITIETQQLHVLNGAQILVVSRNGSQGGELTVNADDSILVSGTNSTATLTNGQSLISVSAEPATVDEDGNVTILPGGNGGNLLINTNELTVEKGAKITSDTFGLGNGGALTVNVNQLNLLNGGVINSGSLVEENSPTVERGNGGTLTISAKEYINISGSTTVGNALVNSSLSTRTEGVGGNAGELFINTSQLNVSDTGIITASTYRDGSGSGITIKAQQVNLDRGKIEAFTLGEGKAGNILLKVQDSITINNGSLLNVETNNTGNAGNIDIITNSLSIGENAELSARSTEQAQGKAGNITLNVNKLNIAGELGIFAETEGIADAGNLTINPKDNNPNLEINFSNKGQISASTSGSGDGGDIGIKAPEIINISGKGIIKVETSGSGDAGVISIKTQNLNLTKGIEINASTVGSGNAGNINLDGNVINLNKVSINAFSDGKGNAGSINIANGENNSHLVSLSNNSQISTEIRSKGEANQPANITIRSNRFNLDNSEITASTSGVGKGGNIFIQTNTPLTLDNKAKITSTLGVGGKGKGGNIIINAPSLSLDHQSEINASTSGVGEGGFVQLFIDDNINLNNGSQIATAVEKTGIGIGGIIEITTKQLYLDNQSQLRASTLGQGNADSILVNADTVTITNGSKVSTETSSNFKAGNITFNLKDSLFLSGIGSGLFANTESNSRGDGGNIIINSPSINLNTDGEIAVNSLGTGKGGDITINTNTLNLDNSDINAQTLSSDGGNLTLNIRDLLTLGNSSNITATAGTAQAGGDGGNIILNAPFIISYPSNPVNTIAANAFEGKGGNIDITTNIILGGDFLTISASSQLGLDGEVIIRSPDIDPTSGLISINSDFVDAESLINQNVCKFIGNKLAGSFSIIGKGGLPAQPTDFNSQNIILTPWLNLDSDTKEKPTNLSLSREKLSLSPPLSFSCGSQ